MNAFLFNIRINAVLKNCAAILLWSTQILQHHISLYLYIIRITILVKSLMHGNIFVDID